MHRKSNCVINHFFKFFGIYPGVEGLGLNLYRECHRRVKSFLGKNKKQVLKVTHIYILCVHIWSFVKRRVFPSNGIIFNNI